MYPQGNQHKVLEADLGFAIRALVLTDDEKTVVVAGRYNKILLGDWANHRQMPVFRQLLYSRLY